MRDLAGMSREVSAEGLVLEVTAAKLKYHGYPGSRSHSQAHCTPAVQLWPHRAR